MCKHPPAYSNPATRLGDSLSSSSGGPQEFGSSWTSECRAGGCLAWSHQLTETEFLQPTQHTSRTSCSWEPLLFLNTSGKRLAFNRLPAPIRHLNPRDWGGTEDRRRALGYEKSCLNEYIYIYIHIHMSLSLSLSLSLSSHFIYIYI